MEQDQQEQDQEQVEGWDLVWKRTNQPSRRPKRDWVHAEMVLQWEVKEEAKAGEVRVAEKDLTESLFTPDISRQGAEDRRLVLRK